MAYMGWGDLPTVTPPAVLPGLGELELPLPSARTDPMCSGVWTPVLSFLGFPFISCGAPRQSEDKHVWETASLGWWDFQRRRLASTWLAKTVYQRMKESVDKYEALEEEGKTDEAEKMWHEVNALNAREIREHAEETKGLFVKATQQMSTMCGVMPDVYIDEFISTTEDLPVSSEDEVYMVIERSLMCSPTQVFQAFDREPVASASIAQVHKARLRGAGDLVAVKVQHDGVGAVFKEDLATLTRIADMVVYWAPDLDFREAVAEFNEVIPRELDFREEVSSLVRARAALLKAGSPVRVPVPIEQLSGREVMVMNYIDAWPIRRLADEEFCSANGLQKDVVMRELLEAFGTLVFQEGLIHGDPHAGNVRLQLDSSVRGGGAGVIFDWGMTRSLTNEERLSLALYFHSLANMDMSGLFQALDHLGCQFKDELLTDQLVEELIDRMRAQMKDTIGKTETRKNTRETLKEVRDRQKTGSAPLPQQLLKKFPRPIALFLRMCECLRGLCVSVEAQNLPVLEIFSKHARAAYKESSLTTTVTGSVRLFARGMSRRQSAGGLRIPSKPDATAAAMAPPNPVSPAPAEISPKRHSVAAALERRVQARLERLAADGKVIGSQVAVMEGGELVCDVPWGTLSTIDLRPVTSKTRFPLLGATPGLASLALLHALGRTEVAHGDLGNPLDMPVSELWPEFGGGSSEVTLRQLLGHAAGLQDAFPQDFGPQYLNNPTRVCRHLELAELPAGRDVRCAYLLQAFAVARLCQCLAPDAELHEWLQQELGPLGLNVKAEGQATVCRDLPALSRVSIGEVQAARKKRQAWAPAAQLEVEEGAVSGIVEACQRNPLAFDPLQANGMTGSTRKSGQAFRAGLSTAASATSLAQLLSSPQLLQELQRLGALELQGEDTTALGWFLTGGATQRTCSGLQSLPAAARWPGGLFRRPRCGFGMVCGLGPCAAHFPDIGRGGVTIVVLVNDVLKGREVAAELVSEVLAAYGYKPSWTQMPLHVASDAARLASKSGQAVAALRQLGALKGSTPTWPCGACADGLQRCACGG